MDAALAAIERVAEDNFEEISNCVAEDNMLLRESLQRRGWTETKRHLEMEWNDTARTRASQGPEDYEIQRLQTIDNRVFREIADLLGTTHNRDENYEERLAEHLHDGYRVAFVTRGEELLGCALWIFLENTNFGRLDYLSVDETWRRRGVGSALVSHALGDARKRGVNAMFLSVDPLNEAARRLYLQHGFRETVISTTFCRTLQSGAG